MRTWCVCVYVCMRGGGGGHLCVRWYRALEHSNVGSTRTACSCLCKWEGGGIPLVIIASKACTSFHYWWKNKQYLCVSGVCMSFNDCVSPFICVWAFVRACRDMSLIFLQACVHMYKSLPTAWSLTLVHLQAAWGSWGLSGGAGCRRTKKCGSAASCRQCTQRLRDCMYECVSVCKRVCKCKRAVMCVCVCVLKRTRHWKLVEQGYRETQTCKHLSSIVIGGHIY